MYRGWDRVEFETLPLLGKTLISVERTKLPDKFDQDLLIFKTDDGEYWMYHQQNCCEEVSIEDIDGDLNDLKGLVVQAEVAMGHGGNQRDENSCTWSFYKIATPSGHVTIRWYGSSNGYYSESVDLYKKEGEEE